MQKYWNTVQDERGNPRYGASVSVQQNGVNSTIYTDSGGLVPAANPLTTDSTRGYFEFYAAAGTYDLVVFGVGFTSYTITAGANLGLPSGDVTFTQSGTGAAPRTMQAKERETVSVTDFYANGSSGALVDPTGVTESAAGIQAAIDSLTSGGIVLVPKGTYLVNTGISANAKNVSFLVDPGATFKAGAAMTNLLTFNKITQRPGLGIMGTLILDMNSLASIGLLVNNCWDTEHYVRVINPSTGTGVKITTDDASFGSYRNRVYVQVSGSDAVGSIGVLVQGGGALNKANDNFVSGYANHMATGFKAGTNIDATVFEKTDATTNGIGYDITSGMAIVRDIWEELNTTNGIVVRTGAIVRGNALYYENALVEGTGILLLDEKASVGATETVTAGGTSSPNVDRTFTNTGNWAVLWRHEQSSGDFVQKLDGTENYRRGRSGTVLSTTTIKSSGATAGIGYAAGAGGVQTQATDKSTTVVLNKVCGQITMNAAALNAATTVTFTLTNSAIASTDVVVLNHVSGGTAGAYSLNAQPGTGSATINVRNITAGNLSEAIVIGFAVVKGVTS